MKYLATKQAVIALSSLYLLAGALFFLSQGNLEFVIYVGVIVAVFALLFGTLKITQFPVSILWLVSIWGLLHVLGGSVQTVDGVLFAYKIYPFLDLGGDFYILKYDQVVHAFLYGVMTVVFWHVLTYTLKVTRPVWILVIIALMASMGVSAMNEIMEFLIAVTIEQNGVGGYENAMLDLIFNFSGAVIAMVALWTGKSLKTLY
jgi:putative membrane protein